jgi:hypothetical protein
LQYITVAGAPAGTVVDLNFDEEITGSYSYSANAGLFAFPGIYLYTTSGNEIGGRFGGCESAGNPNIGLCAGGTTPGSGSFSYDLLSGTIPVTVGTQYGLFYALELQVSAGGTGTATENFLDPASIVNIAATDPTTGLPISDISITSDAGTSFTVNGGSPSTPEPASAFLLGLGLAGLALRRTWRA